MTNRVPYVLPIVTMVLLATLAILAGVHAPAGMRLAFHWNDNGLADGFAGAWAALLIPVGLCAALTLVFVALSRLLGPLSELIHGMLVMMIVYEGMIAAPVFGIAVPPTISPILAVCGLFWILMGNRMPKSRPVLRKPQTIPDMNRAIATSRFSSRFWVVGGIIILAAALIPLEPAIRHIVTKTVLWVTLLVPLIYSVLWRQD